MGCTEIGHRHFWNTKGTLYIQRCEIRCNFCDGEKAHKNWKYAWFLRRHVRNVHSKKKGSPYAGLKISSDWKAPPAHERAKIKHVTKRASQEPDSKIGLVDQKPLPDTDPVFGNWIPPPAYADAEDQFPEGFDPQQARDFTYDNVVHDVLSNAHLLLGTDQANHDDPMLSLLDHDDPQAFMRFIMSHCTHKSTEIVPKVPAADQWVDDDEAADNDEELDADNNEDPFPGEDEPQFGGYRGIAPEAVDELANEFGIRTKTSTHGHPAASKATVAGEADAQDGGDADIMEVDGNDIQVGEDEGGASAEDAGRLVLTERNPYGAVEIADTTFDHSPDAVPDQFFMSDLDTPSEWSELSDRPLAEYFDMAFPSGPPETQVNMMGMLHTTTEEMRAQGMDNKEMLWSFGQFSRGLAMNGLAFSLQNAPSSDEPLEPLPFDQPDQLSEHD